MNFIFGKALLSLLFYTDNPYFFTIFSKFLSLLFPYFAVDWHLKACSYIRCTPGLAFGLILFLIFKSDLPDYKAKIGNQVAHLPADT